MVLSLLWLVERYLRWVTTSFVVTNQRLILRKGVLRRSGREIMLDRLTDITYKQTLSDRLLRCGDILLESPGREGQEVVVDVPRPLRIQNEISRLVSQRQSGQAPAAGWPSPAASTANPASGSFTGAGPSSGELARGTVTGFGPRLCRAGPERGNHGTLKRADRGRTADPAGRPAPAGCDQPARVRGEEERTAFADVNSPEGGSRPPVMVQPVKASRSYAAGHRARCRPSRWANQRVTRKRATRKGSTVRGAEIREAQRAPCAGSSERVVAQPSGG